MEDNKYIPYLKGYFVLLVILENDRDTRTLMEYINDPEANRFLLQQGPMTLESQKSFVDRVNNNTRNNLVLGIVVDNTLIGTIGLSNIIHYDGTAETGTLIGLHDYRSKGYGTDARFALLKHAFHTLGLRKINSRVVVDKEDNQDGNNASIKSLLKCGYKEEARLKDQIFRFGRYYDLAYLCLYREDFERAYKAYQERSKEHS